MMILMSMEGNLIKLNCFMLSRLSIQFSGSVASQIFYEILQCQIDHSLWPQPISFSVNPQPKKKANQILMISFSAWYPVVNVVRIQTIFKNSNLRLFSAGAPSTFSWAVLFLIQSFLLLTNFHFNLPTYDTLYAYACFHCTTLTTMKHGLPNHTCIIFTNLLQSFYRITV